MRSFAERTAVGIRMQGASWSIALPPGRYAVAVVAGDALDTNLTNNLVIGTMPVTDGSPATEPVYEVGNFDGYLQVLTVGVAGAVTIAPGVGALNPTLCVTEIVAIPAGLANEAGWLAAQQASLAAAVDAMNTATMAPGTSDDVIREFVYGGYVDEVVAYQQTVGNVVSRYYPHYNHLYSVAALTDSTGAVVERYKYDAYGKQKITSTTGAVRTKSVVGFDRGFTGYVADNETGLLHARARQYSPTLGRFIGRDPFGKINGWLYSGFDGEDNQFRVELLNEKYVQAGIEYAEGYGLYFGMIGTYQWIDPSGMQAGPPGRGGGSRPRPGPGGVSEEERRRRLRDPPVNSELEDPYRSCLSEGSFRHCVNSCVLARQIPDFAVQPIAQYAGGDLPGSETRDEGDVAANQAGIDLSNFDSQHTSCMLRCRNWFDSESKKQCCPTNIKIKKSHPKCCPSSSGASSGTGGQ